MSKVLPDYVLQCGDTVEPRGLASKEINGLAWKIEDFSSPFVTYREIDKAYAIAELAAYWTNDNSLWLGQYADMWNHLSDDGKTINSAYGYLLRAHHGFDQVSKVIECLIADPYSRRATMKINVPHNNPDLYHTKDEPCTMYMQFFIKGNKLDMQVAMRSNDMWYGLPYDLIYFWSIQDFIAKALNKEVGSYTHFAGSLHIYNKDSDNFTQPEDQVLSTLELNIPLIIERAKELKKANSKLKILEIYDTLEVVSE